MGNPVNSVQGGHINGDRCNKVFIPSTRVHVCGCEGKRSKGGVWLSLLLREVAFIKLWLLTCKRVQTMTNTSYKSDIKS